KGLPRRFQEVSSPPEPKLHLRARVGCETRTGPLSLLSGLAVTRNTMAADSKRSIIAAISGNVAVAAAKFTAGAFTGSSAMLSEGIHSLVDTGDGILLYVGLWQSRRPPDPEHPFGHGKELYFWSLVVAMMIFAVGGGVTIYEGLLYLQN